MWRTGALVLAISLGAGGVSEATAYQEPIITAHSTETLAVTVTQFVVASKAHGPYPLEAEHDQDQCGTSDEPQRREADQRPWVQSPGSFLKAATVSLFTYLLYPALTALLWTARALILRPAQFIYLLFLERPFNAVVSLFLWVLPLLSFGVVVAVCGILIGGMFGWASAVLTGLVHPVASDARHDAPIQKDVPNVDVVP